MTIRHRVSKPLEHFRRILQGHDKLVRDTHAGALAHLVWGRASDIAGEFDRMLDTSTCQDVLQVDTLSVANAMA
eukprot:8451193-Alexandrium_andersonii.AAC.1